MFVRIRLRTTLAATALAGLALVACGPPGTLGARRPDIARLVDKLIEAPDQTRHRGERRVEVRRIVEGVVQEVVYRERVAFDGRGEFSIEPFATDTPVLPDVPTFMILQQGRAGYIHRYRDFRIRDFARFQANYRIEGLGAPVRVAGRDCWEVEISRRVGSERRYVVAADLETGLVMRYSEIDVGGTVLSAMEYLTVDFDPDLAGVAWHVPSNQEQPLALGLPGTREYDDAVAALGFDPIVPTLLPDGYSILEASRVVDSGHRPWLKLTLSDGAESVFFLQAEPDADGPPVPGGPQPAGAGGGTFGAPSDEVFVFHIGAYSVVYGGEVQGQDVFAVGKVFGDELLAMIESALP